MPARQSPWTEDRTPADDLERALLGPLVAGDDVPDLRVAMMPTDSRPPGLEPPLGVDPGKCEPLEWFP